MPDHSIPRPGSIVLIPGRHAWSELLPCGLKRADELAGFQTLREQDHLFARAAELLDVLVDDAAVLSLQHRGFLALAIRRKRDRTNDGLVRVLAQIFCEAFLIE